MQTLNNRLKFKQICTLCASHEGDALGICAPCLDDLPWHIAPQCPQCGLPSNGSLCGHCIKTPPNFDATQAVFTYDYPLDKLLQHYKYNEELYLANTFATLLCQKAYASHHKIDRIIPMPMHATRIKERGFNQALEIARLVSKQLQIPLDYTSCQRTRYTPPQASLPLKERIKNIKGVFECKQSLQGLRVAIIDDVMTTGASLNELAKTLKQNGAAHVECWVMARTLAH
ncbi:MAG: ComF family protein [Methylotenera sp.]|nr:ComF family protein [Methylotenera sp.]